LKYNHFFHNTLIPRPGFPAPGWMIEGEPVVIKVRETFPNDENPEIIKEHFQNLYPGVQVFVEID